MSRAKIIFEEFRADWEGALLPCAACAMARCPEDERDWLRHRLDIYLVHAETPPYSPAQLTRLTERHAALTQRIVDELEHP